jgi:hypothetical protein
MAPTCTHKQQNKKKKEKKKGKAPFLPKIGNGAHLHPKTTKQKEKQKKKELKLNHKTFPFFCSCETCSKCNELDFKFYITQIFNVLVKSIAC